MKSSMILMRRLGGMLYPADDHAAKFLKRLRPRTTVAFRVMRHRSPEQSALYWQCLTRVIEATGKWRTPEELHVALKVAVGYVDVVQLLDGRRVFVPQSTSFDAMTQDEFQSYMEAALRVICTEIFDNISIDELLDHTTVRAA